MTRDINDVIDDAISSLVDDDINCGAEALQELAQTFAKAGQPQSSFQNIRKYIIEEATARTDAFFIAEKLKIAEQNLRQDRKIIIHQEDAMADNGTKTETEMPKKKKQFFGTKGFLEAARKRKSLLEEASK